MKLSIIKGKEFTTIGSHDEHNQIILEKKINLKKLEFLVLKKLVIEKVDEREPEKALTTASTSSQNGIVTVLCLRERLRQKE